MKTSTTLTALGLAMLLPDLAIAACPAGMPMPAMVHCLNVQFADAETELAALRSDLDDAEDYIAELERYLSVDTATDSVIFSDANVYIQSGAGSTDAAVNGLGNLIVGYDEDDGDAKSGSHNVVVGPNHSYSSYGGLVVGWGNEISGIYSAAIAGHYNRASGTYSAVLGGHSNVASAYKGTVVGGHVNIASGEAATVCGGDTNEASGDLSTVTGGIYNTASTTASYAP